MNLLDLIHFQLFKKIVNGFDMDPEKLDVDLDLTDSMCSSQDSVVSTTPAPDWMF